MFKLTSHFYKALCALVFSAAAGGVFASPTYHVSVNTETLAGNGDANLAFVLAGNVPAAETIVTLSNFSGAFGAETDRTGGVTGTIPAGATLFNADFLNYLIQRITLGGLFGFDVSFSGGFETVGGTDGAVFGVSLLDETATSFLASDIVSFSLVPAFGGEAAQVIVETSGEFGSVAIAEVPEPSELLLMLTGLALMGVMLRRRAG